MTEREQETQTATARIYSGRVVTLDVDQVRLPDGSDTVREVVRHRGAVVVLPILDGSRIVFARQYRYPVGELFLARLQGLI